MTNKDAIPDVFVEFESVHGGRIFIVPEKFCAAQEIPEKGQCAIFIDSGHVLRVKDTLDEVLATLGDAYSLASGVPITERNNGMNYAPN